MKGAKDYGLYCKRSDRVELKVFTDSDWVGIIDDKNGTNGGAFFLGKRFVPWNNKKQNCISQSIIEAKYLVIIVNCSNIIWIKKLLKGMKENITYPKVIYCDNTSDINITKIPVKHTKTKQISINNHYLRELVQNTK